MNWIRSFNPWSESYWLRSVFEFDLLLNKFSFEKKFVTKTGKQSQTEDYTIEMGKSISSTELCVESKIDHLLCFDYHVAIFVTRFTQSDAI